MLGTSHIIWNLIDFLVLLFLIKTFLSKPIANAIKGKQESISATLNDVEKRLNEVNKKLDTQSSQLNQIKDEITKIEQQAQNMAVKLKEDIVKSAHLEAEKLRDQIKRNMEQDINKTKAELKKEVTDKALLRAQEIVNQKLDMATQLKLIKDFAMSLDSKNSVN
jgi:F-type H+-transporting ATPase subunit b